VRRFRRVGRLDGVAKERALLLGLNEVLQTDPLFVQLPNAHFSTRDLACLNSSSVNAPLTWSLWSRVSWSTTLVDVAHGD
jgi:hypothetical protein